MIHVTGCARKYVACVHSVNIKRCAEGYSGFAFPSEPVGPLYVDYTTNGVR